MAGIPEIIEDGVNGFLLHNRDVNSASAKLVAAFNTPDDIKARGTRTIEERFSIGSIAKEFEQVFIDAAVRA